MKIAFLMPGYQWGPSGGVRVVYEYANRLANRGHQVTVVHPRRLKHAPREHLTAYQRARRVAFWLRGVVSRPSVEWQPLGGGVKLLFVATSDPRHIPEGDAIFATAWHSVASVLQCPPAKGKKCYLIQHYEVWQGAKDLVDATWRAPLRKIVIAKWLKELGQKLGCHDITHIPNAINHEIYRCARPIEDRPRRVAMMFSREQFKGSADGIRALETARERFPDLKAVFFSTSRPDESIPKWIEFHRNPPQHFIVDEIYGRSSILLCPSLSEGWGLPAAEGAACGCAVVSTDNGGVSEFIQHEVTGLLSPPGEPRSLAENLCRLLEDEPLRVQLARAANSFVSRSSWDKSTDLMEDFLNAVTNC
jgi:glycosyltransferase involved in cell wall biosynthesis